MGDVAMTVPVLRALVLQYPEVKITVVSRPFFQPFFDGIPNVNFFGVDLKERHKGFLGLLRLFSDLRKLQIDVVADLHNVLRSKVVRTLFALSGKKVAATDKGRAEKKALTSLTNKVFAPVKPMVERHVETFKQLGFSIDLTNPHFPEKATLSQEIISVYFNYPFSGIKTQKTDKTLCLIAMLIIYRYTISINFLHMFCRVPDVSVPSPTRSANS